MAGEVVYTVYFGEQKEEIRIMQGSGRWTSLGKFHFPKGKAVVELSDEGENFQAIVADAIRWKKEEE